MSVTIASIITNTDTFFGDASTDRVSAAERLQFITESTAWLLEELGNEHMVSTYDLEYLDSVHRYKVTAPLADLLVGADLRRGQDLQMQSFARKSGREMAEDIAQRSTDPAWAIERFDDDAYLVVNFPAQDKVQTLADFDSLTGGGGTWVADGTNSDAENLTIDTNEFKHGSGSLNFDVDVSNSGNNRATVYLPDGNTHDLSQLEDLGSFIFWVYIPSVTYTSSLTLYWGSDIASTPATRSNYWAATVTTDINGNAFVDGWNEIRVDWNASTATGAPDATAISYFEFVVNYTGSQTDDTDYRLDYFRIAKPETLTFYYISWYVGENNTGTALTAFTATTDVPFFSGKYDQYKYVVAHKAASLMFLSVRLRDESMGEEAHARNALDRYRKNFESSKTREMKSFKILGVNLRRRSKRITRIK